MHEWGIRGRTIAAEYQYVLLAAAVLVVLVGGWLTYTTHIAPATVTEPEVQGTWESTAEYEHTATVTDPNPIYPTGATLENRARYYPALTPELDGTFRYGFDAPDGQLAVDARSHLIIRAVDEETDEGERAVLWRSEDQLTTDAATLAPGESLTIPFTVNVSAALTEIRSIEDDIGAAPGDTELLVRTTLVVNGVAADGDVQREEVYDLSITDGGDTYGVTADGGTERHEHIRPVTRPAEYGFLRSTIGPLLLVLGLGGGAILGVARNESWLDVPDQERALMEFTSKRQEFDDWISRGTVSQEAIERPPIEIESLEDLVDVAVDTDARVIEDLERQRYYVLDGSHCYEYLPPDAIDIRELPTQT